jgi:hypothetical protein
VARAVEAGAHALDFSDIPELEEIPCEIENCYSVTELDLSNTKIADLGPISTMHQLDTLAIKIHQ